MWLLRWDMFRHLTWMRWSNLLTSRSTCFYEKTIDLNRQFLSTLNWINGPTLCNPYFKCVLLPSRTDPYCLHSRGLWENRTLGTSVTGMYVSHYTNRPSFPTLRLQVSSRIGFFSIWKTCWASPLKKSVHYVSSAEPRYCYSESIALGRRFLTLSIVKWVLDKRLLSISYSLCSWGRTRTYINTLKFTYAPWGSVLHHLHCLTIDRFYVSAAVRVNKRLPFRHPTILHHISSPTKNRTWIRGLENHCSIRWTMGPK